MKIDKIVVFFMISGYYWGGFGDGVILWIWLIVG